MRILFMLLLTLAVTLLTTGVLADEVEQQSIPYMAHWPKLPTPFFVRDWAKTAQQVTLLTLDAEADFPYFPVTKLFRQEQPLSGGAQGQQFGVQTYLRATPPRWMTRTAYSATTAG